jgi:hypothetical protein
VAAEADLHLAAQQSAGFRLDGRTAKPGQCWYLFIPGRASRD